MAEKKPAPKSQQEPLFAAVDQHARQLLEISPVGALITRIQEGTILYANQAVADMLGIKDTTSIIGEPVPDFYYNPADRNDVLSKVQQEGELKEFELRIKRHDESLGWVQLSIRPVDFEGEGMLFSSLTDITERKLTEEQATTFGALFEKTADAYLFIEDGVFIDCNQAAVKMLKGKSKDEVLSLQPSEISPEYQPDGQLSAEKQHILIGQAFEQGHNQFEWVHQSVDGDDFIVEVSLTAFMAGDRNLLSVSWRNIAGRKQAEEEIRIFQTLSENAGDAILITDLEGNVTYANQAAYELQGHDYEQQELIGLSLATLAAEDQRERQAEMVVEIMATGKAVSGEGVALHQDGSRIDIGLTLFPLTGESGQPTGIGAILHDITNRKQVEQELLQEKTLSETIINSLPGAFYMLSADAKFFRWNENLEIILGYSAEEIEQMSALTLFPEEEQAQVVERIQETFVKGTSNVEAHFVTKTGEQIPYHLTGTQIIVDGTPYLLGVGMDISDREQAEQARLESQRLLQLVMDNIPQAVFWKSRDLVYLGANQAFAEDAGLESADEIAGKTDFDLPWQEQAELYRADDQQVMDKGEDLLNYEEPQVNATGETTWLRTSKIPMTDDEGNVFAVLGMYEDITEQRSAAQALEDSQRLLQLVMDNIPQAVFWKSRDLVYLGANQAFAEDAGLESADEIAGKTDFDMPWTEQAELYRADDQAVMDKGEDLLNYEEPQVNAAGETTWLRTSKIPMKDDEGNVFAVLGVYEDITERKKLEQQVQEAFERRGYQVQVSTEISQEIAEAAELVELFDSVVDLTKERLGYYHTQLLRYDPAQDAVVLISGYGETGSQMAAEGHRMALGSGLIGTAAETGETVMRPDLAADPDWQPNPLLPETRGEVAVPIKLGDQVLGVLDIQSDTANALSDDDRLLLEGLCGQIAIAMEQTRLRQEMAERLNEINRLYRSMSREGWQEYQTTTTLPEGFQYDQAGVRVLTDEVEPQSLITAPLTVPGGHAVGTLAIADDPENPFSPEDQAFLEQVSEQVALALESARLSEQTQIALARTDELYGISQAINEADTEAEILEALARPAKENGAISAILMYLDLDKTGKPEWTQIVADWRLEGEAPIPIGTRFYLPEMPLSKLWIADPDNPLLISDIQTDQRVDDMARNLMEQGGSQALTIIPLTRGREQIATLIFNWDQPHQFSPHESETYHAIIGLAAPAVQSRRLFARTQSALAAVQQSEADLGDAMRVANMANWTFDLTTLEFTFNDRAYELIGTSTEKMDGYQVSAEQYVQEFVHPEDAGIIPQTVQEGLSSDDPANFRGHIEYRLIRGDGAERYMASDYQLVVNDQGQATHGNGSLMDITERRQAEEAVRQAQERAQTILETVTIPMVITRLADNTLTFANQPAAELIGISLDEFIDQPSPNFYYNPETRQEFIKELQEKGFVTNMQLQLMNQSGKPFWALVSSRVFDYQGDASILSTVLDISERIEAQEATARRAAELATVADVGTTISTILEEEQLLETVVQLTRQRFDLYHCHIFLADENNQTLQVRACGWEEDSPHIGTVEKVLIHTDQEQSLVAQAARDQQAIIVNDVQADPNFLPNELLPETRSEMAIPMVAGNQVLGVLDVQAAEIDRFTDEDISIMTTLASQAAIALQNARTHTHTQQQADQEAMINLISQRIQSTTSVENALQVAIRELGRALGAKRTNVQLGLSDEQKSKQ